MDNLGKITAFGKGITYVYLISMRGNLPEAAVWT
jgi:hypothetical protein